MDHILDQIAHCIEHGKISRESPYPPDLRDQDGADELTARALEEGASPEELLDRAFIVGMDRVGKKFAEREIFVPQMLMSARAMDAAMAHLKPYFLSGEVKRKGKMIIGTVAGDLHDIGKNLVSMMIEGSGWEVIDLGVDVTAAAIVDVLKENPDSRAVALSAMLTTTMITMEQMVIDLKNHDPNLNVLVGGAPVNEAFRERIGADFTSKDPKGAVDYLNSIATV